MSQIDSITLTRPDDMHLHVREGAALKSVVPDTARQFARAIIMPNLAKPVTTAQMAQAYRDEILSAAADTDFEPLMTLYLTDNTSAETIKAAVESGIIKALKLYPAGATTNSDKGVTQIKNIYPALQAMQENGLPLLVHGEVTAAEIDIFDREKVFIETVLIPLMVDFPELKIVLEHITTADAVDYVSSAPATLAATITAHHLLMNRNAIFQGGIRPHHYCLPILKRETHRQALIKAATSGSPKFFLGTDSAPHPTQLKENACGCAGCYSAHAAIELYAEAFEQENALDKLEGFSSFHGPDFYRLPRNRSTITLQKTPWMVPERYQQNDIVVTPLKAAETISWQLVTI